MRALWWKELQELAGLLVFAVAGVALVFWAHTTLPLASYPGGGILEYLLGDVGSVGAFAAFAAGHSRFGPEYQQRTLAFLDALPLDRTRIFGVKLLAGLVPVVVLAVGTGLTKAWALADHPLVPLVPPWSVGVVVTLVTGAWLGAFYATGLVLSWFADVGWQALIVGAMCLSFAGLVLPWLGPYFPLVDGPARIEVVAGWPLVDPGPPLVWAAWGALGVGLAWLLFRGPGDRIVYGPGWIRALASAVVYVPPVLTLLLVIALSALASAVSLPSLLRPTFRAETEHFRFVAPTEDREAAETLVARAEGVRALVAERFGTPGPARLDVELTGVSDHLGGVYIPGKILLRTGADAQVLAHELSHAWSNELGAPSARGSWRFFEEGLATLTESVVGPPDAQAAVPAYAAPASDWLLAPAQGSRARVFNPDEDYSVGRTWAEALVAVGGLDAPPCVIRAAGATPPGEVDPVPWWAGRLATCGVELPELIAAFEARLPRRVDGPPMVGWLESVTWSRYAVRTTDPPPGTSVVCVARADADAPRTQYELVFAEAGEPCAFSRWSLPVDAFELSVGYLDRGATRLGEWRTVRVP